MAINEEIWIKLLQRRDELQHHLEVEGDNIRNRSDVESELQVILDCISSFMELEQIVEINVFANMCGYFWNSCYEDKYSLCINNGYNCKHPDQEEGETVDGEFIGACMSYSCPLAFQPSYDDMLRIDSDLAKEYTREEVEEDTPDYVVIHGGNSWW